MEKRGISQILQLLIQGTGKGRQFIKLTLCIDIYSSVCKKRDFKCLRLNKKFRAVCFNDCVQVVNKLNSLLEHKTLFDNKVTYPLFPLTPSIYVYMYSRASDNGPSEKRTTSLQRTSSVLRIKISIVVILKQPPRSGRFLIPDSGQNSNSQRDFSIQNCLRIADRKPHP